MCSICLAWAALWLQPLCGACAEYVLHVVPYGCGRPMGRVLSMFGMGNPLAAAAALWGVCLIRLAWAALWLRTPYGRVLNTSRAAAFTRLRGYGSNIN